jgi:hypothetical protein
MVIAQILAPSLAAGLVTAGLGIGTITAFGVVDVSGQRSSLSPAVSPAVIAGPVETAGLHHSLCSSTMGVIPGDTAKASDRLCLTEAPRPAHQNLSAAMVFGI